MFLFFFFAFDTEDKFQTFCDFVFGCDRCKEADGQHDEPKSVIITRRGEGDVDHSLGLGTNKAAPEDGALKGLRESHAPKHLLDRQVFLLVATGDHEIRLPRT